MTPRSRPPRGLFITLEGTEGCGKSTQAKLLGEHLRNQGYDTVETREPGGTPLAEKIRSLLLDRADEPVAPETEAFLVLAARRQHVAQVIEPALARGSIVLCDRFIDSTLAYQGYARGLDIATLERLNRLATHALMPDLTLVFDCDIRTAMGRRAGDPDRLEAESRAFFERVRKGFLEIARKERRRVKVIDAAQPVETVFADVKKHLVRKLRNHDAERRP